MKVVHICNVAIPPDHPDYGRVRYHPGRWVLNLAIAQKTHTDILPELLVQVPGASQDYETEIEGVPVHFIKAPDRLRAATLFYFDKRRLANAAQILAPDLVHAHGTEEAYGLAAQSTRLPNIITVQGISFYINRIVPTRLISRARIVEIEERICLDRAWHVIAKSDYVASHLSRRFPHLMLHRIPNTIDPEILRIRETKQQNVVAFVGFMIPVKGMDLLCDAIASVKKQIPGITLWIFGDHPARSSSYEQHIDRRLRAILDGNVVFHGILSTLEVARHVAKAAALVAPSREEMFGNQAVEALAVGTRAIVTEHTAMAENVRRFGAGVVVPQGNPDALAEAIIDACRSPGVGDTSQLRQRILQYIGPETVAAQHEALYRKIVAQRKR